MTDPNVEPLMKLVGAGICSYCGAEARCLILLGEDDSVCRNCIVTALAEHYLR